MQLYLTERLRRHTSRKICLIMPVESVTTPKDNTIIIPYLRGNCKNQVKEWNDALAGICFISDWLERLRVIKLVRKSREKLEIML